MGQTPHTHTLRERRLLKKLLCRLNFRAQELCESRGGRTGLPVPNSSYGLCGRKATLNSNWLNLSYAWRGRNMVRSKVIATERVADFISIWSGDVFSTPSLTVALQAHYRVARSFHALHFDVTKMPCGVSDSTPGSSRYCVLQVTKECMWMESLFLFLCSEL